MTVSTERNQNERATPDDTDLKCFYQSNYYRLQEAQSILTKEIEQMYQDCCDHMQRNHFDHWKLRIKTVESTKNKLEKLHLPATAENALAHLHDLVGARIICVYLDDIYMVRDWFAQSAAIELIEERDYIKHPKASGYRSYHLIGQVHLSDHTLLPVEIQLRTLAMDCFATLEHHLKYKNKGMVNPLFAKELKRCADSIAATDMTLLSIREMVKDHEIETFENEEE